MSGFWNIWVWVLTLGTVVACLWLLQAFTQRPKDASKEDTTGHSWDGDLKEYNNPLPRWWLSLFWLTAVFLVVYLLVFPGLGSFAGMGGWTQITQYDAEVGCSREALRQRLRGVRWHRRPRTSRATRTPCASAATFF